MRFGNGLVQALEICFHSQSDVVTCFRSQSDVALRCCYLVLVMVPRWSTTGGGFCGSALNLHERHMSGGQEDVSSDLSSISAPQVLVLSPAAGLSSVVFRSLFGCSNFTALSSKVRLRRPMNL